MIFGHCCYRMPIRNWKAALNRFMIEFEDRLTDYV